MPSLWQGAFPNPETIERQLGGWPMLHCRDPAPPAGAPTARLDGRPMVQAVAGEAASGPGRPHAEEERELLCGVAKPPAGVRKPAPAMWPGGPALKDGCGCCPTVEDRFLV